VARSREAPTQSQPAKELLGTKPTEGGLEAAGGPQCLRSTGAEDLPGHQPMSWDQARAQQAELTKPGRPPRVAAWPTPLLYRRAGQPTQAGTPWNHAVSANRLDSASLEEKRLPVLSERIHEAVAQKKKTIELRKLTKTLVYFLFPSGPLLLEDQKRHPDTALATLSTSGILKHPSRAPKPTCCYRTHGQPSTSVDCVLQKKTGRAGNIPARPVGVYPKLALVRVA